MGVGRDYLGGLPPHMDSVRRVLLQHAFLDHPGEEASQSLVVAEDGGVGSPASGGLGAVALEAPPGF